MAIKPKIVLLPAKWSLLENYEETMQSIISIIDTINEHKGNRRYYRIDGENITEFSPAVVLILAANLHIMTLKKIIRWRKENDHGFSPKLIDIFIQMGFFRLLNIKNSKQQQNKIDSDIEFIDFISARASRQINQIETRKIIKDTGKINEDKPEFSIYLNNVLDEAIMNTRHHAYPNLNNAGKNDLSRWWITASYNKSKKETQVMCYDKGLTIPGTFHKTDKGKAILKKIGFGKPDSELLSVAIETLKTSTKIQGRGQGLGELLSLIRISKAGQLKIYSRNGMVVAKKEVNSSDLSELEVSKLKTEFKGTLLIWSIIN